MDLQPLINRWYDLGKGNYGAYVLKGDERICDFNTPAGKVRLVVEQANGDAVNGKLVMQNLYGGIFLEKLH